MSKRIPTLVLVTLLAGCGTAKEAVVPGGKNESNKEEIGRLKREYQSARQRVALA